MKEKAHTKMNMRVTWFSLTINFYNEKAIEQLHIKHLYHNESSYTRDYLTNLRLVS